MKGLTLFLKGLEAAAYLLRPRRGPVRERIPGGSGRRGKWAEYVGCPAMKFETVSRQRRRRRGFLARVDELNLKHGFNLPRKVRRRIAWDSWRDGMILVAHE